MEIEMGIHEAIDNLYIIATNEDSKKARDIEGYYEKCFDRVVQELNSQEMNINKLEEENKYLKQRNKVIEMITNDLPSDTEFIVMTRKGFENNPTCDYISKDKIRNKIKELEDIEEEYTYLIDQEMLRKRLIEVLQELLEEE